MLPEFPLLMRALCSNPCFKERLSWLMPCCCAYCQLCSPCWGPLCEAFTATRVCLPAAWLHLQVKGEPMLFMWSGSRCGKVTASAARSQLQMQTPRSTN